MSGTALSLFPTRVAIGRTDATGAVYMSPEFSRALADVLARLGGPTGMGTDDLMQILGAAPIPAPPDEVPDPPNLAGVAALAHQVDEISRRLAQADAPQARIAALVRQVEEISLRLAQAEAVTARAAKLQRAVSDLEQLAAFRDPFRVNWERPGKIGSLTANTVRGTTLESTVATGTAPLIVASTTQVANLNVSQLVGKTWAAPGPIGSTTPAAAAFTTLGTTGSCTFGDGTAGTTVTLSTSATGYGAYYMSNGGALALALGNKSFILGGADSSIYLWTATTLFTNVGVQVGGRFGCNGKTAQASASLAPVATDLATAITLANSLRTMAVNNGMGS